MKQQTLGGKVISATPRAKIQTHCDMCGKKDYGLSMEFIGNVKVYLCGECAKELHEKNRGY